MLPEGPDKPTALIPVPTTRVSPAQAVAEDLIRNATTVEEALLATRVRAEILRQDREHNDHALRLWRAKRASARLLMRDYIDAALQFASLGGGSYLILSNHEWVGGFIAAAGIYRIAKEFVLKKFPAHTTEDQ